MPIIDVKDTFGGGSGSIHGRVPDIIGVGTWVSLSGGQALGEFQETASGYVEASGSVSPRCVIGTLRTPNYRVRADFSVNGNPIWHVLARRVAAENDYYDLRAASSFFWAFERVDDGSITSLASGTPGAAETLELIVAGPRLIAYVGGVQVCDVTDASFASAGQGGIGADVSPNGSFVRCLDFEIVELTNPVRSVA